MPKIYLYAEVLTHLRQLTLHASLETEKNEETKIEISSDKKSITVIHDGDSSRLYLPTQISGTAKVTFPSDKKTELSARVQIEDLEQWKETDAAGIEAPWNASELSHESCMTCVGCDSEILSTDTISSWKDLPTQNWAEIMDLWFCHKPHESPDENQEQQAAEAKGFSAHSRLAARPGVGMVDLVSFVLHPDDCNHIQIVRTENTHSFKAVPVLCTRCNLPVGSFSANEKLVRLHKANLKVKSSRDQPFVSYPPTTFISAELLEIVESTAIRKVIVYCPSSEPVGSSPEKETVNSGNATVNNTNTPDTATGGHTADEPASSPTTQPTTDHPQPQPLLLWIFNPDIYYSSSRLLTPSSPYHPVSPTDPPTQEPILPHRAQKIFYRPLNPDETPTLLSSSSSSSSYESLLLPAAHLTSLHTHLTSSTSVLPAAARTFDTFSVGLLERYERRGTAERVMALNPLARGVGGREGTNGEGKGEGMMEDGRPRVTRWEMPAGAAELYR